MKVLMITPEVAPLVKIGGLADVVGALPKMLRELGHDVRVICPLYAGIGEKYRGERISKPLYVYIGGEYLQAGINKTYLPGSDVITYLIEYDLFFNRPSVYDGPSGGYSDNDHRFAFFSRASLNVCLHQNWIPDIIHCHDWTTGLVPVYLNTTDYNGPLGRAASIFTIHNLQHQGYFSRSLIDYAHLPHSVFRPDNLEAMGAVNMLKGGLYNATKITTVSPSYAREIQEPGLGCGLNDILKFRAGDLIGVLNGIDTTTWSPNLDPLIPARFSIDDFYGKATCKNVLQEQMGLKSDERVLLFGLVSRLYDQKGLDLLLKILPRAMLEMEIQIVVLGSGDPDIERSLGMISERNPDRFAVCFGYDEELAHLIYAGSDCFLMPSRFEPCGLSQLYSMQYGTPPLVRATGGLIDTVEPYVQGTGTGTGFVFEMPDPDVLYYTMQEVCATFYDRKAEFHQLRRNGMKCDFSWDRSAKKYSDVYGWAHEIRAAAFSRVGFGLTDRANLMV